MTADDEHRRAGRVAEAVVRAADSAGMVVDEGLTVWELAGGLPPRTEGPLPDGDPVDGLAAVLERATDDGRRRSQGLHVTPTWLADRLVGMALPDRDADGAHDQRPSVCDPACGGGAFLVAAARRLHRLGVPRRDVVQRLVWGADIDAVGVAAAEAALWLWAGERPPDGRLVVADPLADGAAIWPGAPAAFGAVVGNPPFQSQLGRSTARSAREQERLRARFGPAVRAYTDSAWLFLLAACDLVRPGGRVVMVQPQSVVAARDADQVRRALDRRAVLRDLWLDDGRVFDAAVRVCAPVLERRRGADPEPTGLRPDDPAGMPPARGHRDHGLALPGSDGDRGDAATGADRDRGDAATGADGDRGDAATGADRDRGDAATGADGDRGDIWGRLWARATGLPDVELGDGPTLGERASVFAGFRDQYYGLIGVVRERRPSDDGVAAPLVTSGVLDWASCAWGERPVRYAKRRWRAPVVDLDRLAADAPPVAQRWVARTRAPKLVVATQTRVVEAAVDAGGTWVPSVPTIAVVPGDPDDLWPLAAAVLSPAATAWLVRRSPGTGLDRGALKVAGPDLVDLPLPRDPAAWEAAAAALRALVAAPEAASAAAAPRTADLLDAYLAAAAAAYDVPAAVTAWWRRQVPVRAARQPDVADGPGGHAARVADAGNGSARSEGRTARAGDDPGGTAVHAARSGD